jgi:hypothetical protein
MRCDGSTKSLGAILNGRKPVLKGGSTGMCGIITLDMLYEMNGDKIKLDFEGPTDFMILREELNVS